MRLATLSALLFVSGCSALLFQTLWLRLSGLVFGNSVWSAALILSSFMAGLALGSAIAARSVLRRIPALRFYAALELIVAVAGCLIVFELPRLGGWISPLAAGLWEHQGVLNALRFSLSFLILLIPATAMGMTLPVLLGDPLLRRGDFGRAVGVFYGSNTLGAVSGAVLGEAYLVERFGLLGTGLVASAISCAAAGAGWLVSTMSAPSALPDQKASAAVQPLKLGSVWRLLLLTFAAAAILLALEVIWFRFLRLYVASSSTAFAVMLAVVLAGIGMGGIIGGAIHRRAAMWKPSLPILLLLAALATLMAYEFFPAPERTADSITPEIQSWLQITSLSCALMLPTTLLSGILFPFVAARVQDALERPMSSAGVTMLCNTIGSAAGPLLAGFLLLPKAGLEISLLICGASYGLLALLAIDWSSFPRNTGAFWSVGGLIGALALVFALFPYGRDEVHFANARRPYEADGSRLIRTVEGTADTFQLLRRDFLGEPYYYRLLTNGFSMSGTHPRSQRYMRLFAYLPLALRPESEDVLQICYGVGVTADAFVRDSRLKRIDIVDISHEVFDLSPSYQGLAYGNPLEDPRVATYVQDGRFFLQASPRSYDVITGEPPPLKVAGTVNLYTQEFFELVSRRLKQGGVATFWLPIYQVKVEESKAILAAFLHAFPNSSVWAGSDQEWIMMGIKGPGRRVESSELGRLWREPRTLEDLSRMGFARPEHLAALFLMDSVEIARITRGVEPLTDFYPKRISDKLPDPNATHEFALPYTEPRSALRNFAGSHLMQILWPENVQSALEPLFVARRSRYMSVMLGSNWLAELAFYLRYLPLPLPIIEVLGSDERRVFIAEKLAGGSREKRPDALHDLIAAALARGDRNGAIRLLESEEQRGFDTNNDFFLLVYLYCLSGDVDRAEALARARAASIHEDWFVKWLWGNLQAEFGFRPPA